MAEGDKVLDQAAQTSLAERLQTKWLEHMERLLDSGLITSTDMATLARVLLNNGWTLDPAKLPQRLKDALTSQVSPEDLEDVLPINKKKVG